MGLMLAEPCFHTRCFVDGKTPRGNCDGCFLKSEAARAALIRDYPERAAWWEAAESRIGRLETQKGRPVDNSRFDKRGDWEGLRKFIERQGAWAFDTEDRLCQTNDGECI